MKVDLGPAEAWKPGDRRLVPGVAPEILVLRLESSFRALQNRCPHARASLLEHGTVRGQSIVCDWHDLSFDLDDGVSEAGFHCLRLYPTSVGQDGRLYVETDDFPTKGGLRAWISS